LPARLCGRRGELWVELTDTGTAVELAVGPMRPLPAQLVLEPGPRRDVDLQMDPELDAAVRARSTHPAFALRLLRAPHVREALLRAAAACPRRELRHGWAWCELPGEDVDALRGPAAALLHQADALLETSREGWIERGGDPTRAAAYDPALDAAGPVSMALALEVGADSGLASKPAKAIAVGDADVFTNNLVAEGPGNATFAVNAVRWLVGDDARLSVVGRPAAARRLAITQGDLERVRALALLLGPLLAVLAGAGVWASRRGR
jgi:hypothetical protein